MILHIFSQKIFHISKISWHYWQYVTICLTHPFIHHIVRQLQALGRPDLLRVLQQGWDSSKLAAMGEEGRQFWVDRSAYQLYITVSILPIEHQVVPWVYCGAPIGYHTVDRFVARQCTAACPRGGTGSEICGGAIFQLHSNVPTVSDQVPPHQ